MRMRPQHNASSAVEIFTCADPEWVEDKNLHSVVAEDGTSFVLLHAQRLFPV